MTTSPIVNAWLGIYVSGRHCWLYPSSFRNKTQSFCSAHASQNNCYISQLSFGDVHGLNSGQRVVVSVDSGSALKRQRHTLFLLADWHA